MRKLVDQRHPHLRVELGDGLTASLVWPTINRDLVRQRQPVPMAAFHMGCALVKAEDRAPAITIEVYDPVVRLVFDDDRHIGEQVQHLRRQ